MPMQATVEKIVPHTIADWPAVKVHFPCTETSGLRVTDEVTGLYIDVSDPALVGSASFSPPGAVTLKRSAAGTVNASQAWQALDGSKYIVMMLACRPKLIGDAVNGLQPGGSNSYGSVLTMGTRLGLHYSAWDGTNEVSSGSLDASKKTTADTDCLLVMVYKPVGQNIECSMYAADGSLVWASSTVNASVSGTLQPPATAGLLFDADYPNDSGYWHQSAVYQHIIYQFDALPSDLAMAIQWHRLKPRSRDKSPYPGWKFKT